MKLKELGEIITGNTPSKKVKDYYESNDISFFKPGDLDENYILELEKSEEYISEKARGKARIIPKNSILVTCIGTIGKVGILLKEASCNQQINAIIPNKKVLPKYLAYSIFSKQKYIQKKANAPVVPIINKSDFSDIDVKICDLDTQRLIAQRLDSIKNVVDIKKRQITELDNLIKSQFVEMFGDPEKNEKNWGVGLIRDLISDIKYGTSRPAGENGRHKYLRMNNITYEGKLDLTDIKYIDVPENEIEKCVAKKGDILFNRTNSRDLVGKTCVYNNDESMIIAGFVIRARVNKKANPYFISEYMNTKYMKNKLKSMCKNACGQSNINSNEFQNIRIYIPPIELQNKFASFVEHIDKLEFELKKSLEETQNLFDSLMAEYFE